MLIVGGIPLKQRDEPIEPEGTINIATKLKIIIGTPILYILLCTSITMLTVLSEMAETHGWDEILPYWGDKILAHPILNTMIPAVLTVIIIGILSYKGKQ